MRRIAATDVLHGVGRIRVPESAELIGIGLAPDGETLQVYYFHTVGDLSFVETPWFWLGVGDDCDLDIVPSDLVELIATVPSAAGPRFVFGSHNFE